MRSCYVCGKVTNIEHELMSPLDKKLHFYCTECIAKGLENYNDLINYGWEYNQFSKSYRNKIVYPTLLYNQKTVEQFDKEVRNHSSSERT